MSVQTSSQIDTSFLDLPGVFQTLLGSQRTGILVVRGTAGEGEAQRGVRFEQGMIRMVIDPANPRFLLDALVRAQRLSADHLAEVRLAPNRPQADQLRAAGLVDDEALSAAYQFHAMEAACELFAWAEITCEFVHGEPNAPPWVGPDLSWPLRLNPTAVVMEACRRLDEGKAISEVLPSLADIPQPLVDMEQLADDPAVRTVYGMCDGQRDVYEILEAVPLSRFEARLLLSELLRAGVIALAEREQMLEVARSLMKSESGPFSADQKTRKLIRLYERVEERGYRNLQLAIWLGRAYELAGRTADAIARYIDVSAPLMQQQRGREAVEIIARAINLDPSNPRLRELLVEAYLQDRENEQAAEIAVGILRNLRAAGSIEEAKQLALAMRSADPENERVLEHLAELHLAEGDRTSAILELEELAGLQIDRGDLTAAATAFERVIGLDYYHLMAHFRLAQTLHQMGRTDEAVTRYKQLADMLSSTDLSGSINWQFLVRTYENIAEIEVDNILAKEWLARTYLEQGKVADAQRHLQAIVAVLRGDPLHDSLRNALMKLVELRPSDLPTRKLLAETCHKRGERDQAVKEYLTFAELALTLDRTTQAQSALDTAMSLDPLRLDVHQAFAELYTDLGLSREAAAKLRDVGYLLRACNRLEDAEQSFRQAIAVEPTERTCLLELASSYLDRAQPEQALRLLHELSQWAVAAGEWGYAELACRFAERLDGASASWVAALRATLDTSRRERTA